MATQFNHTENTRIYKSFHGWMGVTKTKVNGKCWELTTMKRNSGAISTHCHIVEDLGGGAISFSCFQPANESFHLNVVKGVKATEQAIKAAHYKALAEFDAKQEAGELPSAKEEYKIEVGQVLFTDNPRYDNENRRAIYAIEQTKIGTIYKTVNLDGTGKRQDSHIRPYSEKFGIGVYYKEGDVINEDQVLALLIDATEYEKQEEARKAAQAIIDAEHSKARAEFLSQFKKADRRTTSNIIKKHILKTWPSVQKVEVKSDSFSGGDSLKVWYHAPARINELESFIDSFKYGHFNGMEDIYESNSEYINVILDGYILEDYKYTFANHVQVEEVAEVVTVEAPVVVVPAVEVSAPFELVEYSEKALAVFGNTKAIKDQLKAIGGRFNPYLNHNGGKCAGWIFSKAKEQQLRDLLK